MPTNRADLARKVLISDELKKYIDINTDFGQTRDRKFFADTENRLLDFVSSVNIPCGVHDGDPKDIMDAIETAKSFNCTIGAHVGYPDAEHQGYANMTLSEAELEAWLHLQIGGFQSMCLARSTEMVHVRPHGALYGKLLTDRDTARQVAQVIYDINPWLILVGPAGPALEFAGQETGLRVAPELYLGKRYNKHGRLFPENLQQEAAAHLVLDQARSVLADAGAAKDPQAEYTDYITMHLSPAMENVVELGEKLCQIIGQPVNLPIATVGPSGWV